MSACEGTTHIFELTAEETDHDYVTVPRGRKCDCGEYTWGWMDDTLELETAWDNSP